MKAVFNIGFTLSSPPSNYSGNRRAEYIAQRNFYNLTAEYNYFDYTLNGKKVTKNANAEHYFTREGTNTGLFNMDGSINASQVKELKQELKDTKSTIWHGFISFDDETSQGFCTQENCIKFMRQTFGGFLTQAGFKKSNINLYCSLHEDTNHRHIHFAFFEKQPIKLDKYGNVGFTRRGKISAKAIDNYLISANMHLDEHAEEYYSARDKAIAELNRMRKVKARSGFIDGRASTASIIFNAEINSLIKKLPKKGRLQYNSKSMERLHPTIDRIAELLIHSDSNALQAHERMLKEFSQIEQRIVKFVSESKIGYMQDNKMTPSDIATVIGEDTTSNKILPIQFVDMKHVDYFESLKSDYKARVGNVVLNICKDILYSEGREFKRVGYVNSKHKKIEARFKRLQRLNLLNTARRAITAVTCQECANYLKSVKQHERDIAYEDLQGYNDEKEQCV